MPPFVDCVEPEFHEMLRTGVFGADEMNHIRVVCELVEVHADEVAVEVTTHGIVDVIERLRHEDAFVAGERHRLGEARVVDVVDGTPG